MIWMPRKPFRLLVITATYCVLCREGEDWTREFSSVQDALDHARTLPEAEGAQVEVLSETGQRFMIVYV